MADMTSPEWDGNLSGIEPLEDITGDITPDLEMNSRKVYTYDSLGRSVLQYTYPNTSGFLPNSTGENMSQRPDLRINNNDVKRAAESTTLPEQSIRIVQQSVSEAVENANILKTQDVVAEEIAKTQLQPIGARVEDSINLSAIETDASDGSSGQKQPLCSNINHGAEVISYVAETPTDNRESFTAFRPLQPVIESAPLAAIEEMQEVEAASIHAAVGGGDVAICSRNSTLTASEPPDTSVEKEFPATQGDTEFVSPFKNVDHMKTKVNVEKKRTDSDANSERDLLQMSVCSEEVVLPHKPVAVIPAKAFSGHVVQSVNTQQNSDVQQESSTVSSSSMKVEQTQGPNGEAMQNATKVMVAQPATHMLASQNAATTQEVGAAVSKPMLGSPLKSVSNSSPFKKPPSVNLTGEVSAVSGDKFSAKLFGSPKIGYALMNTSGGFSNVESPVDLLEGCKRAVNKGLDKVEELLTQQNESMRENNTTPPPQRRNGPVDSTALKSPGQPVSELQSLDLSPISIASSQQEVVKVARGLQSPGFKMAANTLDDGYNSTGHVKNFQSTSSHDIAQMEQLRSHLQGVLRMGDLAAGPATKQLEHPLSLPGSPSYLDRKPQDATDLGNILSQSAFLAAQMVHNASESAEDSNSFKRALEKELCRRQHCERVIRQLQAKILQLQQQLAVTTNTTRKKDLMIEQLDNTLAKVVEGWKKREADKKFSLLTLNTENKQLKATNRRQQEVLKDFEAKLAFNMEQLQEEQKRTSVEIKERIARIQSLEMEQNRLHKALEMAKDQLHIAQTERDFNMESKQRLQTELQSVQSQLELDKTQFREREKELLSRVENAATTHEQAMEIEREKYNHQNQLFQDAHKVLTATQLKVHDLQEERDVMEREKESLKVQIALVEAKMESSLTRLEADLQSEHEKELTSQLEECSRNFAEKEEAMRDKYKKQLFELNLRHSGELESQLKEFNSDQQRKDERHQQQVNQLEQRLAALKSENDQLQTQNKRFEQQRVATAAALQRMTQDHCQETLRVLSQAHGDQITTQSSQKSLLTETQNSTGRNEQLGSVHNTTEDTIKDVSLEEKQPTSWNALTASSISSAVEASLLNSSQLSTFSQTSSLRGNNVAFNPHAARTLATSSLPLATSSSNTIPSKNPVPDAADNSKYQSPLKNESQSMNVGNRSPPSKLQPSPQFNISSNLTNINSILSKQNLSRDVMIHSPVADDSLQMSPVRPMSEAATSFFSLIAAQNTLPSLDTSGSVAIDNHQHDDARDDVSVAPSEASERQSQLQHYVRMLLSRSPGSTVDNEEQQLLENLALDREYDEIRDEDIKENTPPTVKPNRAAKHVAFSRSTLLLDEAKQATGEAHNVTAPPSGNAHGTLSHEQVADLSHLLARYRAGDSEVPLEDLLGYLQHAKQSEESNAKNSHQTDAKTHVRSMTVQRQENFPKGQHKPAKGTNPYAKALNSKKAQRKIAPATAKGAWK